jgi:hypothetical protein
MLHQYRMILGFQTVTFYFTTKSIEYAPRVVSIELEMYRYLFMVAPLASVLVSRYVRRHQLTQKLRMQSNQAVDGR